LANLCPNCGFENPPGFRFCGNCGANLLISHLRQSSAEDLRRLQSYIPAPLVEKIIQAGEQIKGQRRTVTVLFADLRGFTALSEQLDPDEVYNLLEKCFKAFVDVIYQHEGTVDNFTGDGLVALFGAPVAHENDPERAIRAALDMHAALDRLNQQWPDLTTRLQARIGLNTGEVIVGSLGSDLRLDYTAIGDTVNVAARLEKLAEPGTVLVSQRVYQATQPLFEFQSLGAVTVKGRTQPVEVYQVLRPRRIPARRRGVPGLSAPLIGRNRELSELLRIVGSLSATNQGHIVLVTGEAGIGKSRLTQETKAQVSQWTIKTVEGNCRPYGQSTYGIFIEMLQQIFGLAEEEPEESRRARVERRVRALMGDESLEVLPYLEHLLSLTIVDERLLARIIHLEPDQLRQQIFLAVRRLLEAEAARQPLLLIFEDLHWVDKPSLDLLLFLLNLVDRVPVLFYCISRPAEGLAAARIARLAGEQFASRFTALPLSPLSPTETQILVDRLLTIAEIPAEWRTMIFQQAEGNPFYLEEIIRMLIDRGLIERHDGYWRLTPGADFSKLQVPPTLQGLILARVDSLPPDIQETLHYAAVIGRTFSHSLLCLSRGRDSLTDHLDELVMRDLIVPLEKEQASSDGNYVFKHVLTQEAIYDTLLQRRKLLLHRQVGEALEIKYENNLEEHVETLAYHFMRSEATGKALSYLIRAGAKAASRYANEEARYYYTQAEKFMERTPATVPQQLSVYVGLGDLDHLQGHYDTAREHYQLALLLGRRNRHAVSTTRLAEIGRKIGRSYERQGDYAEAMKWLRQALDDVSSDPLCADSAERARIYNDIGWVYFRQGDFDQAYDWSMRCLGLVEGTDNYSEIAAAYNRLAGVFVQQGDWQRAAEYVQKSLEYRERIGFTYGVASSYNNLAGLAMFQGHWHQAVVYHQKSLELCRKIGDAEGTSRSCNNLGLLYKDMGNYDLAESYLKEALEVATRSKNAYATAMAYNNLGHVSLLRGQPEQAMPYLEEGLRLAEEIGSREHLAEGYGLLGEAYLALKQPAEAERWAQKALDVARDIGSKVNEGIAWRILGQSLIQQQNLTEGRAALEQSMAIFTSLGNEFERARSRLELARLVAQEEPTIARSLAEEILAVFHRLGAEAMAAQTAAFLESLLLS